MAGRTSVAGRAALALNSGPSHSIRICSARCCRRGPARSASISRSTSPRRHSTTAASRATSPGSRTSRSPLGHRGGQEVEVVGAAEFVAVPGQLGAQRGAPGRVEQQAERAQVGADAAHGHPGLVDTFGRVVTGLGTARCLVRCPGPQRTGASCQVEGVHGVRALLGVVGSVAHVVEEEGAGRHGQHPVEDHSGGRVGEEVVGTGTVGCGRADAAPFRVVDVVLEWIGGHRRALRGQPTGGVRGVSDRTTRVPPGASR